MELKGKIDHSLFTVHRSDLPACRLPYLYKILYIIYKEPKLSGPFRIVSVAGPEFL